MRSGASDFARSQRRKADGSCSSGISSLAHGGGARALVILTAVLLAFGLATVYSASAIVEMQAGNGHAHSARCGRSWEWRSARCCSRSRPRWTPSVWEKWAWPVMILSLFLLVVVILPFTSSIAPRIHGSRRYLFGGSLQPSELASWR